MGSPTSSQRISFAQLVLDMGLADAKALAEAKQKIKDAQVEGKKLTIARACVDLGILTEKQAKRVQLELKKLKEGLASSSEFAPDDDASAEKKTDKAEKRPSKAGKVDEAKEPREGKKVKDPSAEGKVAKKAEKAPEPVESEEEVAARKGKKAEKAPEPVESEEEIAAKKGKKAEKAPEPVESEEEVAAKRGKKAEPPARGKKAPAVEESESKDAASDSDSEAPSKAQLGKAIELDSQRAEPQAAPKPVTKKRTLAGLKGRGAAAPAKDDGAPRPPSKVPLLAAGGLVVLLLMGLAIGVALQPKKDPAVATVETPAEGDATSGSTASVEAPPGQDTPAEEPAATPARPKPAVALSGADKHLQAERLMDKLAVEAGDLADAGKFAEAVTKLEGFDEDLRDQKAWREVGEPHIAKYRALLAVSQELDAALEGDQATLVAMIKKVEAKGYAHASQSFVARFRAQAREKLGDKEYDKVLNQVAKADARNDLSDDDLDDILGKATEGDDLPIPVRGAEEVTQRGSAERRAKMREAAKTAQGNLTRAQKKLEEDRAKRRQVIEAEAARVIKATKKDKLQHDGKDVVVTAYDEQGFTCKIGKEERTFGWFNAPAALAHDVRFRAIDTNNGAQVFELGVFAVRRGLFDHAKRHFDRAAQLDKSLTGKAPDLGQLEHYLKLFRGKNRVATDGPSEVQWKFEPSRDYELLDFSGLQQGMDAKLVGGQLEVGSQFYPVALARVRGSWEGEAQLQAIVTTAAPPPMIGLLSEAEAICVSFGDKTELLRLPASPNTPAIASSDVRVMQGNTVVVSVKRIGDDIEVKVKVADREAFTHKLAWDGEFGFILGVRGQGAARFDDIVVSGKLSAGWIKRTQASGPNEIARFMNSWQSKRDAANGTQGAANVVPYMFRATSAEDPVALEGINPDAIALVGEGRQHFEAGNYGAAVEAFRKAAEKDPDFHAANYLYACHTVRRDPEDLFRVERGLKGIEDFYEAMVIKGEALVFFNRVDESKQLLAKALELRPDYPPAYGLKASLLILEGKYPEALDALELANVLGPGDPMIIETMGQARALAEGPGWANRKRVVTERYVVDTDYVEDADRFARVLEGIRARYVEAFPNLVNPDAPKRQASVLVFNQAEDYYVYSEQTTNDRKENTGGHFNPMTGQLLLFLDATSKEPGALHVLQHEAMHQWAHAQMLALPFWANEGMAEYIGGTTVTDDGRVTERAVINSFLKDRLKGMTDWRASRLRWNDIMTQSPQEFYSGRATYKYGQAWTMIHYFMESGDRVMVDGPDGPVERPIKDIFMDYLNKYKAIGLDHKARGGSRLEYVYVDTFHQIEDLEEVEKRYGLYVEKLAEKCGVKFMSLEDAQKAFKPSQD